MANIERVKAVVGNIEKQLEWQKSQPVVTNVLSFNMKEWFNETKNAAGEVCGTAMCLAGWAAHSEGLKMYQQKDPEWGETEIVVGIEGRPNVEEWAEAYFGFTPEEAEVFYFTGIQNLEELKSALNYILEEDVFEGVPHYYSY